MKRLGIYRLTILLMAPILILCIGACDDTSQPTETDDSGDVRPIRIAVIDMSGDNAPLPGVKIVIDNKSTLTCTTADPTGDCNYMLRNTRHTIVLSKPAYTTKYDTFDISSSMTVKYFGMSKEPL